MRIKVRQTDFLDIEFDNDEGNTGDNSDSYNFTIETHSQHCTVNGVEMPKFTFTINYILNMRKDNVAQAMAGHTFVNRYENVDLESLINRR